MKTSAIPFHTIDWKNISRTEHPGETGMAYWQSLEFEGLRVRLVEYSENYIADHWCEKGHIVYCLEGEVINELKDGSKSILTKGMSYIVSDNLSTHRSISVGGVKLLIIDGKFLQATL
jgi:hypothetical protein